MAAPLDAPADARRDEVKPMGPIAVDVRVAGPVALGVAQSITVTARATAVEDLRLEVHANPPAALVIAAPPAPVDRPGERRWTLTVVPLAAEGASLTVLVAGEVDGVTEAQSVTTPLGPPGSPPQARAAAAGAPAERGGEKLSLLPVEERF